MVWLSWLVLIYDTVFISFIFLCDVRPQKLHISGINLVGKPILCVEALKGLQYNRTYSDHTKEI